MADKNKEKAVRLNAILDEIAVLTTEIEEKAENDTPENREKLTALLTEGEAIRKHIEQANTILGLKNFAGKPTNLDPAGGDGEFSQQFTGQKSLGDQLINFESYKQSVVGGKTAPGTKFAFEAKGFMFPAGQKATFTTTGGGLDSTVNYVNTGGIIMVEQQRLTIRDLLAVGETTMNSIPYIKELSFTNAADMVAEEGEKPEATLSTDDATAPVKKIAVVLKVTDEMFADFPMMRDYVNTRLRFMVLAKEEQQLLNGSGSGNQITGILNVSGIQTQAKGGDTNADAIHKAITKVRSVGFYEPDALVIHPTDWQLLKLAKDTANQYFGGGPFMNQYGSGGYQAPDMYWGLKVVVTTAIAAGTALVGAFKLGAQIWQRQGVVLDIATQNEDDFNFNRVTVRVEERLALAVYRPLAFCTVTSIA